MTERKSRAYAYFGVTGFGDCSEITLRLGLHPSSAWSAGDARPNGHGTYPATNWELRSKLPDDQDLTLDKHIEWLLTVLNGHREQVRSLHPDFDLWIGCVAYYVDYQAGGLHLDLETVRTMADLGLQLDFDIYCECADDGAAPHD